MEDVTQKAEVNTPQTLVFSRSQLFTLRALIRKAVSDAPEVEKTLAHLRSIDVQLDNAYAAACKPAPKAKRETRTAKFQRLANEAEGTLNELLEVQQEYQEWLDNLPENLQSSALGEKLSTLCEIDLQGAADAASEAANADMPQGFGRD